MFRQGGEAESESAKGRILSHLRMSNCNMTVQSTVLTMHDILQLTKTEQLYL